ncbi:hypothetical protein BDV36DRAFT_290030 [Aspergillus pseudocaelatus]|uniref:Uncharacterized protein n=1 Tax=Aspergillus pseudocaelatus TaxID=1825620 RepID=A0ABQ6X3M8_9EURO|nr:hypothetical protein BDV36DRAFT_290030 [Aspergillus pseudocaelatus]
MGQRGCFSGWDADSSGSDERPVSSKSLVSKAVRLSRRIKHRRHNGYHRNSRVATQRAPGSSHRIKTLSQDIAVTIEEDPGYEAEDDDRGRSILKSRRYAPRSQGYIYELPGSFPESDQSVYDTAPEATTTPLSERGSSDLAHESLLTALEAGTINAGYDTYRRIPLEAPTPYCFRNIRQLLSFGSQDGCPLPLANLRLTEVTRDDIESHPC